MKAIVCEMCGSQDLVKQGGFYVCQNCGTKYSTEEAKKLMVEVAGTVDVSGSTVQIDNSSFVEKYLQNARRAKQKEDWEEAEKYYNMVEQNDPNNIEAIFYSAFSKAKTTLALDDFLKRKAAFNSFQKSISIIDDNYDIAKEAETKDLLLKMSSDLLKMTSESFTVVPDPNVIYGMGSSPAGSTNILLFKTNYEFAESLSNIANKFPVDKREDILYIYKEINKHLSRMTEYNFIGWMDECKSIKEKATPLSRETTAIIKQFDQNYSSPSANLATASNGGCYVATAVYGSYDCPQVWTLRRYRDYTLAETWLGRLFILLYYAISPTLVKWFGET